MNGKTVLIAGLVIAVGAGIFAPIGLAAGLVIAAFGGAMLLRQSKAIK